MSRRQTTRCPPKKGKSNKNQMSFKIFDENIDPGGTDCTTRSHGVKNNRLAVDRATKLHSIESGENELVYTSSNKAVAAPRQPFGVVSENASKNNKDAFSKPSLGPFGGNGFSIYCDDDSANPPTTSQEVTKKYTKSTKDDCTGRSLKTIADTSEGSISASDNSSSDNSSIDSTSSMRSLDQSIPNLLTLVQRPRFQLGSSGDNKSSSQGPASSENDEADEENIGPSPIILPPRCPLAPLPLPCASPRMAPKRILSDEEMCSTSSSLDAREDELLDVQEKCRIRSAELDTTVDAGDQSDDPGQLASMVPASLTFWTPPDVAAKEAHEDLMYACPEYAVDIHSYMRYREKQFVPYENYMKKQKTLTSEMRAILVDWLVEVQEEYKLADETLFLAVSMVDRFLSLMNVSRQKLQLVGIGSMFIAAKYEEVYPPNVHQMVYITDDTYSDGQLRRMELCLLNTLKFQISIPTTNLFLQMLFRTAKSQRITKFLALYICQLCMLNLSFLRYLPSMMASAAFCLANLATDAIPWPESVETNSGYYVSELYPVMEKMLEVWRTAEDHPNQAIRNKYSANKFFQVSTAVDVLPCLPPIS